MTSELRPAVAVWDLLWDAFTGTPPQSGNPNAPFEAAAAVIEADREAVRAEQAAEVAKWRDKYNELGQLALEQVSDLGTKLGRAEVELDAAKADLQAANRELTKFKALAETLGGALEQIVSGTYPRPLGKPWRMDASSSKHDRCIHDAWMYETCEGCLDAFVAEALRQYKEARDAS